MSHILVPAPVSVHRTEGHFRFHSGTTVVHTESEVSPVVERFCVELTRRTGLQLEVRTSTPEPHAPALRIEVAPRDDLRRLPAPLGVSPAGAAAPDERYALLVDPDAVVLRAAQPIGVARGLTSLLQLAAATPSVEPGTVSVPASHILDAPRYAWRGLSLDLARAWFILDELRQVIDLLALYKLNVLHLHLTDDQAWRLPMGRSAESPHRDANFYRVDDLRALAAYAADRFVTVVPEVDTPGHVSALVQMHQELSTGRNRVDLERPSGETQPSVWLDPELPATWEVVEEVLAGVAGIFLSPFLHIGGDEPRGMPHDLYTSYVRRVREYVRSIGRRPLGWQESARAGLGRDDIIQYWRSHVAVPPSLPREVRARMDAELLQSQRDLDVAAAAAVPVIVSPLRHCYLDVPYAERSAHPAQTERQNRLGLRLYPPMTIAGSLDWDPAHALGDGRAAQVAGVEAAIWCETVSDFDDLTFLLLPRLAGVAQRAWAEPHAATWTEHRQSLARHARLWREDDLTYFRAPSVGWDQADRE